MKINWQTGIVLAMIGFISFILYFVISMTTNKKYDFDLVVDDYYKQELLFQAELDAQNNALTLDNQPDLITQTEGIRVVFPKNIAAQMQHALISFYRGNQKSLDFSQEIVLNENHEMLIPASDLVPGRWNITITWEVSGQNFMVKKNITF